MLNKGKAEKEKSKKKKMGNKMFFYAVLIIMFVMSFLVRKREDLTSVQAGNFGCNVVEKNISFSDFAEKVFIGGRFEKS